MTEADFSSKVRIVLVRLAGGILPSHHKDWAEAMFNEMAYIPSRRTALRWALGSTWCAIRLRASYEFGKTVRSRATQTLLGLVAVAVIAALGVYSIQRPYQRERILAVLFHGGSGSTKNHGGAVH